jgi:hypothetical protein
VGTYRSTGGGGGRGLKGWKFQKETSQKKFAVTAGKNLRAIFCYNSWENGKILRDLFIIFNFFQYIFLDFWSNFEVDFGDPCDYHKSVKIFLKFL